MAVFGPNILTRTLSASTRRDQYGNLWQYHPRSDHHSRVACFGIIFDLMRFCPLLRRHAEQGVIGFGVNHKMTDFRNGKSKKLDLVICTAPSAGNFKEIKFFDQFVKKYSIDLDETESHELAKMPRLARTPVGAVLIALEAKACMTAHQRALPRLYSELDSSHFTVHGANDQAVAAGFVMVNAASHFLSPELNEDNFPAHPKWSVHRQPRDASLPINMVHDLPRRTAPGETGYDAFGISVVSCRNDGSTVSLVDQPPAPPIEDIYHYASMIDRAANLYATRFKYLT